MNFPDISEWYTPERIAAEEPIWEKNKDYVEYTQKILTVCKAHNLVTVIEVGCGTGWVPLALDSSLTYLAGIDKNPYMLERARAKNPGKTFIQRDIRSLNGLEPLADLVCSFSVLKHFSLAEWAQRLRDVLTLGKFGLFTQPCFTDDRPPRDIPGLNEDDSEGFHGYWSNSLELAQAVRDAGHEIIEFDGKFRFDDAIGGPEAMITTRRVR